MGFFNPFKNLLEVLAAVSGILGRKSFFNLLKAVCASPLAKWTAYLLASLLILFAGKVAEETAKKFLEKAGKVTLDMQLKILV